MGDTQHDTQRGCAHCGKPATFLCTRCVSARYCCRVCQRSAWPSHKLDCVAPEVRQRQMQLSEEMRRLLGSFGDVPLTFDDDGVGDIGGGGGGGAQVSSSAAAQARSLLRRLSPEYAEFLQQAGGGMEAPPASESGAKAPPTSESGAEAPSASESGAEEPPARESGAEAPPASESGASAPLANKGGASAPLASKSGAEAAATSSSVSVGAPRRPERAPFCAGIKR